MCGLFCIISKKTTGFSDKDLKIFTEGLFADTVRGKDSTGVFSISEKGNVYTLKNNISGDIFINSKEFENFMTKSYMSSRILVGHNRSATLGITSAKNAHPFISGNTVLVHNGTLFTHKELADTETDSEAITKALELDTFTKVLPKLNGAFALIWYNAKEKKFYTARNNDRPLWIIQTKDFDLIGSESKLLEWILFRNTNIDQDACYFAPYSAYIWDLNKLKDSYIKTVDFEKKKTYTPYFQTIQNTPSTPTNNSIFYRNIQILPFSFQVIEKKVIIQGTNPDYPNVIFQAILYNRDEKEIASLEKENTLFVKPYSKSKDGTYNCTLDSNTIFLYDIKGKENFISKYSLCSICKTPITKNHSGLIWTRTKQNQIKTILCPSCVEKNPNLKL